MPNEEQLAILGRGVEYWNRWRAEGGGVTPDLTKADLSWWVLPGVDLAGALLSGANLHGTDLSGADLRGANLSESQCEAVTLSRANLAGAYARSADLSWAELSDADFTGANLGYAHFFRSRLPRALLARADLAGAQLTLADLRGANLEGADLMGASLVHSDLTDANLAGCRVFGISAWRVNLAGARQEGLIITDEDEPEVRVDDVEVAQFIYLLLHNEKIRRVIDTITSHAVLILGRFTRERKAVLDAMADALRRRGWAPIVFDFEKPRSRDLTETVSTLAHLSRFVIADLTDPASIPHELVSIIPDLPSLTVLPILHRDAEGPYAMFEHLQRYPWVRQIYRYRDDEDAIAYVTGPGISAATTP